MLEADLITALELCHEGAGGMHWMCVTCVSVPAKQGTCCHASSLNAQTVLLWTLNLWSRLLKFQDSQFVA